MWFPGAGSLIIRAMEVEEAAEAIRRAFSVDLDIECTCGEPADRPCTFHDGMGGIDEVRP